MSSLSTPFIRIKIRKYIIAANGINKVICRPFRYNIVIPMKNVAMIGL